MYRMCLQIFIFILMRLQLPLGHRLPAAAGGVNPAARDGRRGLRLPGPELPDIQGRRLLLHLPVRGDGRHFGSPEVTIFQL